MGRRIPFANPELIICGNSLNEEEYQRLSETAKEKDYGTIGEIINDFWLGESKIYW